MDFFDLKQLIADVIDANPQLESQYRSGDAAAFEYLVDEALKGTRGRIRNRRLVAELLRHKLGPMRGSIK